nr:nodulation protein [Melilotus officinalis]
MKEAWRFIMFCRMVVVGVMMFFMLSMKHGQCLTMNNQGLTLQRMNGEGVIDPCYHGNIVALHFSQQVDIPYNRKLLQTSNSANSHKTKRFDHKKTPSPSPSSSPTSSLVSPSQSPSNSPSPSFFLPSLLTSPELSPSPSPVISPTTSHLPFTSNPPKSSWISAPSPAPSSNQMNSQSSNRKQHSVIIWSTVGGFSFLVLVTFTVFICFRSSKVVTVKPWTTGLSGQLRKAFVTGIPSLKRAELELACEDFSNIIGSLQDETIYKGTLSSGVEIAVVSSAATSSQDWSKNMQAQFRKKIEMLSRVNHKNFVNLIGYCEENKPFTRMMVFEYAPNGTLFEHLHIREAEQLDWGMRKRIAMGIAYCLDRMHQLTPPMSHRNLQSSSIYLTEDYAAKISDLSFYTDKVDTKKGFEKTSAEEIKDNVYSFGVILRELVDTSLKSLKGDEVEKWFEVINSCVDPDEEKRLSMKEVTSKLKEITDMGPDGATPKTSPLWWAEIEIMSSDIC